MSLKVVAAPLLWSAKQVRGRRRVRALVHRGFFMPEPPAFQVPYAGECYFMKVTNLSQSRTIQVTHIWFDTSPPKHILDKRLPAALGPDETFETWMPVAEVPDVPNVEQLGRVRLSSGKTVESQLNKTVPPAGRMAGPGSK
jgi:hypothetical protein